MHCESNAALGPSAATQPGRSSPGRATPIPFCRNLPAPGARLPGAGSGKKQVMTQHLSTVARSLTEAASTALRPVRVVLGVVGGLLVSLYALAVCTTRGQLLENTAVLGSAATHPEPTWLQNVLATVADDSSLLIAMAMVLIIGWQQRRLRTGIVAAATILAANIATQILKNLVFVRPDLVVDPGVGAENSLPSGTVTFLLSTALGLVMVLPRFSLARAFGFLLVGTAIAGGCVTIMLGWHRPADVVAGVVVVIASFAAAHSFLDRKGGSQVRAFGPSVTGLLTCGAITLLPLLAVLVAPTFAADPGAYGPHVYLTSMVVVAVASTIATVPLISLLGTDEMSSAPVDRSAEPGDSAAMTLETV